MRARTRILGKRHSAWRRWRAERPAVPPAPVRARDAVAAAKAAMDEAPAVREGLKAAARAILAAVAALSPELEDSPIDVPTPPPSPPAEPRNRPAA